MQTRPLMTEPFGIEKPRKFYQVGTLRYSVRALTVLFVWLLWGDFAFCFFENIFGRFIPLYLNDLHASNTLIGIMTGTIAGVVNLVFLPEISRWIDEYRGPRGRRIPFLAVCTPITVGSLSGLALIPLVLVYRGWKHHGGPDNYVPPSLPDSRPPTQQPEDWLPNISEQILSPCNRQ